MSSKVFSPLPINDQTCGWTQALPSRQPNATLQGEHTADFVIAVSYTHLTLPTSDLV